MKRAKRLRNGNGFEEQAETAVKWAKFHAKNPQVYRDLVILAKHAKKKKARLSIRTLCEVLRWVRTIEESADPDFKVNDHFMPHYARLIMDRETDLKTSFDVRERQ